MEADASRMTGAGHVKSERKNTSSRREILAKSPGSKRTGWCPSTEQRSAGPQKKGQWGEWHRQAKSREIQAFVVTGNSRGFK